VQEAYAAVIRHFEVEESDLSKPKKKLKKKPKKKAT
jgi:hypothetical protein